MDNLTLGLQVSKRTRTLALKAIRNSSLSPSAQKVTKERIRCPVDYMRYAEFEAVLRDLKIDPQMRILDIGSPQWFSLYLASEYPDTEFCYVNIVDNEIAPYEEVAKALGIQNLNYRKEDARGMQFDRNIFDRVISISVIEHIYPEEGGDLKALNEIHRILKIGGEFLMTIPYKMKSNILYKDGAVYERQESKRNFYAREYDKDTFDKLLGGGTFH